MTRPNPSGRPRASSIAADSIQHSPIRWWRSFCAQSLLLAVTLVGASNDLAARWRHFSGQQIDPIVSLEHRLRPAQRALRDAGKIYFLAPYLSDAPGSQDLRVERLIAPVLAAHERGVCLFLNSGTMAADVDPGIVRLIAGQMRDTAPADYASTAARLLRRFLASMTRSATLGNLRYVLAPRACSAPCPSQPLGSDALVLGEFSSANARRWALEKHDLTPVIELGEGLVLLTPR